MTRYHSAVLILVIACSGCSSVGVHSVRNHSGPVRQAPEAILVEAFSAPLSAFHLGDRSRGEKDVLRRQIVDNLARSTASQLRTHAAPSSVVGPSSVIRPGRWLVRGQILRVDQGNRALRATIGLGKGRTEMQTRVAVYNVTSAGLVPLLSFKTKGSSGLEPGAAFGVATGGATLATTAGSLAMASMPGVSTDVDRTSYEIAAVLSLYLQRHGLLGSSRVPVRPNMKGELPTTINFARAIPAPLRQPN